MSDFYGELSEWLTTGNGLCNISPLIVSGECLNGYGSITCFGCSAIAIVFGYVVYAAGDRND